MPPISPEGINAAADWIQGELQKYSSQCGNCLEAAPINSFSNRLTRSATHKHRQCSRYPEGSIRQALALYLVTGTTFPK